MEKDFFGITLTEEQKAELEGLATIDDLLAFSQRVGVDIDEEDIKKTFAELSDDDLNVAGGWGATSEKFRRRWNDNPQIPFI